MSHEVNTFDLPEEGFNTDLTTVEVEKLGDVNVTQNVDAVPVGGTTGQVLAKNSNTDYDTEWVTGGGGGGGSGDIKADGTVPFAADQSMGGNQLTNVGYPSAMTNAASKTYIDDKLGIGLTLAPDGTNFATIGNTSIVNGLQVFTGQLVGCLNDSNNDSGIFVVGASSSTFLISPKQMVIVGGNTKGIYTLIAPGNTTYEYSVTKAQVGLGNVDNTSDANKPVSTATQTAINYVQDGVDLSVPKLDPAITPATKTKVTYNNMGQIIVGADATTADIADSANKRYVTDANLTLIGNTSGTNTGDETTVSGLADTDFGFENGDTIITVAENNITNANIKGATFLPQETANTSLDDFQLNAVSFQLGKIIDNTSFEILGTAANNAGGIYQIKYILTY